jgi:hypothetical protein
VPTEAITERLAVGGFRVKSDVDLDTAMSYAVDLTKLGGACVVVDAQTGEALKNKPARDEPVGLAAASGDIPIALGALADGEIVVSTLDGEVDQPPLEHTASAFAAPGDTRADLEFVDDGDAAAALALDASPYNPTELAAPSRGAFAPPPSAVGDDELLLMDDPLEVHHRRDEARAPIVLPEPTIAATSRTLRPRGPSLGTQLATAGINARLSLARRGSVNFMSGAVLAVVVGFLAAHIIASIQETNAFPPLEKELGEAYAEAVDRNAYAALPEVRADLQLLVESRQRRIAITGGLVWLAAAAAFGFVWFRKIPWETLEPRGAGAAQSS